MNGIFAVKKPSGPTSQDVVGKLKHIFTKSSHYQPEAPDPRDKKFRRGGRRQKFIKIGHGGTLDPLAEGTLIIGVGSGTKQLAHYLGNCSKVYTARALLGASTTTYDAEGAVLEYGSVDPRTVTQENLSEVLTRFRGSITQLPPVFSALKMDGRPLYEYAREGIPLPRAIDPRPVEVSSLESRPLDIEQGTDLPTNTASDQERAFAVQVTGKEVDANVKPPSARGVYVDLTFSVSSGTYIRTLIHDIGEALGTKAHMVKLVRDSQGDWELGKNVLPLEHFNQDNEAWWPALKEVLSEGPRMKVAEAASTVDPLEAGRDTSQQTQVKVDSEVEESKIEEPKNGVQHTEEDEASQGSDEAKESKKLEA